MELPDEVLVKILSYLSSYDILKRIALVSKIFYRFAQDKHLLQRTEFEFKVLSVKWSEDRKENTIMNFWK